MADISYFYLLDDNGQPVLNDAGEHQIKWRGQTSTLAELKQMITDNRPQKAINTYLGLVAKGMNWAKYDEWLQRQIGYENAMTVYKAQLNFYNSASDKELLEKPVEPTEPPPLEFEPVTAEYVQGLIDGQQWEKRRIDGYGSIESQLDMIFHQGLDVWKDHIQKVKDDNPKVAE